MDACAFNNYVGAVTSSSLFNWSSSSSSRVSCPSWLGWEACSSATGLTCCCQRLGLGLGRGTSSLGQGACSAACAGTSLGLDLGFGLGLRACSSSSAGGWPWGTCSSTFAGMSLRGLGLGQGTCSSGSGCWPGWYRSAAIYLSPTAVLYTCEIWNTTVHKTHKS